MQTYVPYLFLVIPLGKIKNCGYFFQKKFMVIYSIFFTGPVTLTGQDYVLVESGCTCRPKYSRPGSEPNPASIIPSF